MALRRLSGVTSEPSSLRILGVDPGSRLTGFGVIDCEGDVHRLVAAGTIRTTTGAALPDRLRSIYNGLREVITTHRPGVCAVEQVFVARSADSALKLGQARGVALLAAVNEQVPIVEYAARRVKQTVTGSGSAGKDQVQRMVKLLLGVSRTLQADAADALALALCHAQTARTGVLANLRWRAPSRKRRWTRLP